MPIVRVDDNDLYYEVRGGGPGLPAVLIMGLGVNMEGWRFVAPVLEQDRRLLLLDNRGVGRSAKPKGPYTTDELADDAAAVMAAAGIERAHVVGISLGGAIAQKLALRHRPRVASLALLATFAAMEQRSEAVEMARTVESMANQGLEMDPRAVHAMLMPFLFSPEFIKRERALLREMFERALAVGISTRGFAGQLAAAWSHRTVEALRGLDLPALVVTGTRDKMVPPGQSRIIAEAIPGARLVEIEGALHGLVIEQAEQMNELLRGWLRERD